MACIFNIDLIYCSHFSGNIADFQYTGAIGGLGYELPTLRSNEITKSALHTHIHIKKFYNERSHDLLNRENLIE